MSSVDLQSFTRIKGPTFVTSSGGVALPVELCLYKRGATRVITIRSTATAALTATTSPTWTHNWGLGTADLTSSTAYLPNPITFSIGAPTNADFVTDLYLTANTIVGYPRTVGGGGANVRVIQGGAFDAAQVAAGAASIGLQSIVYVLIQ